MIQGIGLDIVEIERIHQIRTRQSRFPEKVLTKSELEDYQGLKETRKSEF